MSENTFQSFNIEVYENFFFQLSFLFWEHNWINNRLVSEITLHNYILYQGELTYIEKFPVVLGMPLIFTDFQ